MNICTSKIHKGNTEHIYVQTCVCIYIAYIYRLPQWFIGEVKLVKLLSRVWLFATPWTVAHQAPPSMGFSRQEYWSGLPFLSPGYLPNPGIEPRSPTLQAEALTLSHQGSPAWGFFSGEESASNTGNTGDAGSIPGLGRSSGGGNGNLFPYSFLGKSYWQRSLAAYSPWSRKRVWQDWSDIVCTHTYIIYVYTHTHTHTYI